MYNRREHVHPDPLWFLYEYDDLREREVAALVASSLAFGNVKQIMKSVRVVFGVMGPSPLGFMRGNPPEKYEEAFPNFKHRWATGRDIALILRGVRGAIMKYGSLEACFMEGVGPSDENTIPALTRFAGEIVCADSGQGTCLIPSPCRGSACKRLNLFLRWMVRNDGVDPGGWTGIPASKLIVPLDVHMHRIGRALGMTGRKQADLRAALEITDAFRKICPEDPVRYDFALTRLGMRRGEDGGEFLDRLGIALD